MKCLAIPQEHPSGRSPADSATLLSVNEGVEQGSPVLYSAVHVNFIVCGTEQLAEFCTLQFNNFSRVEISRLQSVECSVVTRALLPGQTLRTDREDRGTWWVSSSRWAIHCPRYTQSCHLRGEHCLEVECISLP